MTFIWSKKEVLNYLRELDSFDKNTGDIECKITLLSEYVSSIIKWSKIHNIVSRKSAENDLWDAVIDSITGASFLSLNGSVYDAGSGGGFPGFVLAIMYPKLIFSLVESNRKKCSFLLSSKTQLQIKNINVINSRIELLSDLPCIITKAAFSPAHVQILAKVLQRGGVLSLWTTPKDSQDFQTVLTKAGLEFAEAHPYVLPGAKERVILTMLKRE